MKRSSKILALILSVMLLVGTLVTSVFASDNSASINTLIENQIKVSAAKHYDNPSISVGSYSAGNSKVDKNVTDMNGYKINRVYNTGAVQTSTADTFVNVVSGDTTSSKIGTNYASIKNGEVAISIDIINETYRELLKAGEED